MDLHTTIIGAGPYGLSLGAHLGARGHSYQMFGSPMESWRTFMPAGMVLKSEPFASNLWDPNRCFTLENYCRDHGVEYQPIGRPVPLDLFLRYAEWFRQNTQVEPVDVRVSGLRRIDGGFALELGDGRRLTSRRVVLATGYMAYGVMPDALASIPAPVAVHCSRMDAVHTYAGRDVTVIGAGQSALETAALLHEAGAHACLLIRESRIFWNSPSRPRPLLQRLRAPDAGLATGWQALAVSELPRVFRRAFPPDKRHRYVAGAFGPSGAWWLRDRVDGRIECSLRTRVVSAANHGDGVKLRIETPDGTKDVLTDRVIAATGYRVDINRLDYLAPDLKQSIRREGLGVPELSSKFETSVPGLYMVGITSAPVFGSVMRFMFGAKHAAPILTKALCAA